MLYHVLYIIKGRRASMRGHRPSALMLCHLLYKAAVALYAGPRAFCVYAVSCFVCNKKPQGPLCEEMGLLRLCCVMYCL
jgi:hypothetical protein